MSRSTPKVQTCGGGEGPCEHVLQLQCCGQHVRDALTLGGQAHRQRDAEDVSPFMQAVLNNDGDVLEAMVHYSFPYQLDGVDSAGLTPIMWAAYVGAVNSVRILASQPTVDLRRKTPETLNLFQLCMAGERRFRLEHGLATIGGEEGGESEFEEALLEEEGSPDWRACAKLLATAVTDRERTLVNTCVLSTWKLCMDSRCQEDNQYGITFKECGRVAIAEVITLLLPMKK